MFIDHCSVTQFLLVLDLESTIWHNGMVYALRMKQGTYGWLSDSEREERSPREIVKHIEMQYPREERICISHEAFCQYIVPRFVSTSLKRRSTNSLHYIFETK